jgi:hypothetical protein
VLVSRLKLEGWVTGVYRAPTDGSRVRVGWWAKQCALYVASLVLMKGAVIAIFALLPVIFVFGSWILEWLDPHAQVVFVMALFPLGPFSRFASPLVLGGPKETSADLPLPSPPSRPPCQQ